MPRNFRCLVVLGTAVLLADGCSQSHAPAHATSPTGPADASAKQHYLDTVNGLCDELLPKVIQVTHGGSTDIPARTYLQDWPAHQKALSAFDQSSAAVPVPAAAASAAAAMRTYITFADGLDAARLKAARQGEQAWRREVASVRTVSGS